MDEKELMEELVNNQRRMAFTVRTLEKLIEENGVTLRALESTNLSASNSLEEPPERGSRWNIPRRNVGE